MNKVILIGNLTKDAELKYQAGSGMAIAKFTVAVPRNYKDKNEVDFINCTVFNKMAENLSTFTKKGSKVCVEGSLRINSYKDKDGNNRYSTEVYANNVEFLSHANSNENKASNNTSVSTKNDFANDLGRVEVEDLDGIFGNPLMEIGDDPFL